MGRPLHDAFARVGGRSCTRLLDVTNDLAAVDSSGFWVVVAPDDAAPVCARFGSVGPLPRSRRAPEWIGPAVDRWESGMDEAAHARSVDEIRAAIAAGDVYQVNLTRRLSAPLPAHSDPGCVVAGLGRALAVGHPAPHAAVVHLPAQGISVASASPELFVARRGRTVWSSPIKGTADDPSRLGAKDRAENVMIVDLVRNDLGRVCEWGTVTVPSLLALERHPGLVHLVSTVQGTLRPDVGWAGLLEATFPPGSVTGAPKIAACSIIDRLEPTPRGVYCGAVGWVDADRRWGSLNVAIRTFWVEDGRLHFGTGGAITWDSVAADEWRETELKAARLLQVAGGHAMSSLGAGAGRVWIDGRLVDAADAMVHYDDRGLTVGDGVFETVKFARGALFALEPHLRRLSASAATVGLPMPGRDELDAAIAAVVADASTDGFVRITLTAGRGTLGSRRESIQTRPIVAWREGGIRIDPTDVVTSPWPRNERGALAGVKSISYAENIVALALAAEQGASEALFANTVGELCEGAGSNVFVGIGGRLVTPPLSTGCLAGVTRALLLELVDVDEVALDIAALADADEVFLASTSREVQPVRSVDGRALPRCPGRLTRSARQAWVAAYG